MRKIYEAAILFLGTLGWWGFVYPELCLDGEVYEEEACKEETGEEVIVKKDAGWRASPGEEVRTQTAAGSAGARVGTEKAETFREPGWQLGEIRIKSRLMEYVCQIKENVS